MLDFHNHLMPGVDDGAQTLEQACAALNAFAAEGVRRVITTPHVDASVTRAPGRLEKRLSELDRSWHDLATHVQAHHPDVEVWRGVELMMDAPEPAISDPRLRLAGGPFLLMEFPFMTVPPRSGNIISDLRRRDCVPILAHPERYHGFAADYSMADHWRRQGAYLQINGASLLGRYGSAARRFAFGLLERGWVDYVCSDYHARGSPSVQAYRSLLLELGGAEQAQLLCESNPARVPAGQPPLPVPPLYVQRSFWSRVAGLFRPA